VNVRKVPFTQIFLAPIRAEVVALLAIHVLPYPPPGGTHPARPPVVGTEYDVSVGSGCRQRGQIVSIGAVWMTKWITRLRANRRRAWVVRRMARDK
jgi:hypothetical protein